MPILKPEQRIGIYQLLIGKEKRDEPGNLDKEALKEVAALYGFQPDAIQLIWKRGVHS